MAVTSRKLDLARILVELGADIDTRDNVRIMQFAKLLQVLLTRLSFSAGWEHSTALGGKL